LVVVSYSPAAFAASGDRAADRVLGQPTFFTGVANHGSLPTASRLHWPYGVFVDQHNGRLFVADRRNWRVQIWSDAGSFANGAAADLSITLTTTLGAGGLVIEPDPIAAAEDLSGTLYIAELTNSRVLVYSSPYTAPSYVIGQQSFTANFGNQGLAFPTASTLSGPYSLATDDSGHLFVADLMNSRIVRYTLPITTNNQAADLVLGQADFGSWLANRGNSTPGANTLNKPQGVAVDSDGSVYVSDSDNNRVLKFAAPLSNGMAATLVLGQSTFISNSANQGRGPSYPTAQTLNIPSGIAVDKYSRIYVSDFGNFRMVGYSATGLVNGAAARFLIGQPDFDTPAYGPAPPSDISLGYPYGVAVDSMANVYVADRDNNRVLRYDFPWDWEIQLPLIIK
jgi:sugar lactone lactonase YvrE